MSFRVTAVKTQTAAGFASRPEIFLASLLTALNTCAAHAEESRHLPSDVCGVIELAAHQNDLPINFFTRLIWQESRFNKAARSSAGAQGVAQFMPATAMSRGLLDPFEFTTSLYESAAYLKDLRQTFGNVGLAAAAYNAGPGRLSRWMSGQTLLPQETLNYVQRITGHAVAEWNVPHPPSVDLEADFSCLHFAASRVARALPASAGPTKNSAAPEAIRRKEWAVILVASVKQRTALAEYQIVSSTFSRILGGLKPSVVTRHIGGESILRSVVQIEKGNRQDCETLCNRIKVSGGYCTVSAN
jgi:hypothetical protein